ncbi:MAG: DUF11 domain-containing protein [Caldilineae bacterium]|nr:MAG: DUF11 domain-containing protein [Caldilineae bacterium]
MMFALIRRIPMRSHLFFQRLFPSRGRIAKPAAGLLLAVLLLAVSLFGLATLKSPPPVLAQGEPPHLLITKTLNTTQLVSGGPAVISFTLAGAGDRGVITNPLDVMLVMDISSSMQQRTGAQQISGSFATPNSWESVYTFTVAYPISDTLEAFQTLSPTHLVRFRYQTGTLTTYPVAAAHAVTVSAPISAGTWVVEVNRNGGGPDYTVEAYLPSTKIHAAIHAGKTFVDSLTDTFQVGLASFNQYAYLNQPLTSTRSAVISALNGLATQKWTFMAGGIITAHTELITSGHAMKNSVRAMVIIGDGKPSCDLSGFCDSAAIPQAITDTYTVARRAVTDGVILYTIGFGKLNQSEQEVLQNIANISLAGTGKGRFFYAPDSQTLEDVYRQIAQELSATAASFVRIYDLLPPGVTVDPDNLPAGPPTWVITQNPDGSTTALLDINEAIQISETLVYTLPILVNWTPGESGTVNLPGSGVTYTNYLSVQTTTLFSDTAAGNPRVDPIAGLTVGSAGPALAAPGHRLTYTLYYSNPGTVPITNAQLVDVFPSPATVLDAGGGMVAAPVVTWNLGTVPGGATGLSRTLVLRLSTAITQDTTLTNTARVMGQTGSTPIKSFAVSRTLTVSVPALALSLGGPPPAVQFGERLTYTLHLTGGGSTDATGVVITATLPTGLRFAAASDGGTPNGGSVVWDVGSVASGAVLTRTLAATVEATTDGAILTTTARVASVEGAAASDALAVTLTAPALSLQKTASAGVMDVSDTLTYTLVVANSGSAPATAVTLTDTPDGNTTPIATDGGSVAGGQVVWNLGTLGAGGRITRTLAVTVRNVPSGTLLHNTAQVAAAEGVSASDAAVTRVLNPAFLSPILLLTKTIAADPLFIGQPVQYTLQIANIGSADATALVLTDTLDSNLSFVSASHSGSFSNGVVTWNISRLSPGEGVNRFLTVQAQPVATDTAIPNRAAVLAAEGAAAAGSLTATLRVPRLQLSKSAAPDPVPAGSLLTYTLVARNDSPAPATGAVLTDPLASGLDFVSASDGGTFGNGVVTWNGLSVPGNGALTRTLVVRVAPVATDTTLGNQATLTATEGASAVASAAVAVQVPHLQLSKLDAPDPVSAGGRLTYTLIVRNSSAVDASGVVLSDTLDANVGVISATPGAGTVNLGGTKTVTWNVGALVAGQTATRTLVVTAGNVPSETILSNLARAAAAEGSTATAEAQTRVLNPGFLAPILYLTQSDTPDPVQGGNFLTYTLVLRNGGSAGATGVLLTDTLDASVTFSAASDSYMLSGDSKIVSWTVNILPVGQTLTRTLRVVAGNVLSGTQVSNLARATAANAEAVFSTESTTVFGTPALNLTKSAASSRAPVGGSLQYTLVARNSGTADAAQAVLTDTLDANLYFVAADGGGTYDDASRTVRWDAGGVAAGSAVTRTLTVTVGKVASGTILSNSARLVWNGGAVDSNNVTVTAFIPKRMLYLPLIMKNP